MDQLDNLNYKVTKAKVEGKIEVIMIDAIIISEIIRIGIGQIVKTGDSIDRIEVDLDMYRRGNFRGNARIFDRQNNRGE